MKVLIWFLIFYFGAIWGSFFYTLAIHFINRKITFKSLFSRSICPKCETPIKAIDLVPLLSFIVLRGKCRNCTDRISILYPLAELLFGLLACAVCFKFDIVPYAFYIFIFLSILIVISFVDIKTLTIPNPLVIVLALLMIFQIIISDQKLDMLYGGLFLTAFFLVFFLLIPGSFGFGDVKLTAVLGTFCGLIQSIIVLEGALITGAFCGVTYMIARKKGLKTKMPFGPFLALGFMISIFYGDVIAIIYFRFVN